MANVEARRGGARRSSIFRRIALPPRRLRTQFGRRTRSKGERVEQSRRQEVKARCQSTGAAAPHSANEKQLAELRANADENKNIIKKNKTNEEKKTPHIHSYKNDSSENCDRRNRRPFRGRRLISYRRRPSLFVSSESFAVTSLFLRLCACCLHQGL